jgi:2,3-diketo-5-methylthio-1-phosphopentane phosphatase
LNQQHSLVVDFDGTTTIADVGDEICDRFGDASWRELDRAWERKEIGLHEAQRIMWGAVRGRADEILGFVREVGGLRPGFDDLLMRAREDGWRVVLASGGFDFYIEHVLGAARIGSLSEIFCNRGALADGGVRVDFPWLERFGCPLCGVCKGRVCDEERLAGRRVVFVGDGTSDRCVRGRAATIYAVRGSKLAKECGSMCVEFEHFEEISLALHP